MGLEQAASISAIKVVSMVLIIFPLVSHGISETVAMTAAQADRLRF
jgi:hypothetical protein